MTTNVENLAVSIPGSECNKNCPYCIAKITKEIPVNEDKWYDNLKKAKHLAQIHSVNNVLFTGKGEPLLNKRALFTAIDMFKEFPLELQTNGILLKEDDGLRLLEDLSKHGLDTISISVDFLTNMQNQLDLFYDIFRYNNAKLDMNIRLAVNITSATPVKYTHLEEYIDLCKRYYVNQIIIRNVTAPSNNVDINSKHYKWIKNDYLAGNVYEKFLQNTRETLHENFVVHETTYGMRIYDIDGISFVFSDYCIQENNIENNAVTGVRSLIYQQDGHMYTSWNSLASRIF